ncbi:MAG TPA: IS21 family transposase [Planctomycetaceae bacterium]|nr:IS21 family transposase [Planctomycetaceae bacterium]
MQQWTEIRRRVLSGEISKRAACREYSIHWDTLQKMLTHVEPPGYRQSKPRGSKIEPFVPIIHQILKEDQHVHRKQRHTAKKIFERLREEHGYDGGITLVQELVREWKHHRQEVFLPLVHRPGEAQVDFGFADVLLSVLINEGRADQSLSVCDDVALFGCPPQAACSGHCTGIEYRMQAFPRECTEAFLEGHKRAFQFFEGVPTRISYDNAKVAVARIVGNRERTVTREFLRLQSHFLFKEHFCLVRRPNEKGHVERLLDFARRNFLVPVPQVDSMERLNEQLLVRCDTDLERKLRGKSTCKRTLLSEEQLRPLPRQIFEAHRLGQAHADSLSLVRFETNSYSVPTKYAHRAITIVATIDEVRLIFAGQLIARHCRHWGREEFFFDPVHYLALLERKPGGFDHARPLEDWDLPLCFGILRRRLEADFTPQLESGGGIRLGIRCPQCRGNPRDSGPPQAGCACGSQTYSSH